MDKKDPKTKQEAIQAFKCFEPYNRREGQEYARVSRMVPSLCENEVVDLLSKIRLKAPSYNTDPVAVMSVEQNAQVIL